VRISELVRTTQALPVIAGAVILGSLVTWSPVLSVVAVLCLTLLAGALVSPSYLPRLFLRMLGVLLIGYAFLGKSFAYIGVGPIYIGDITLGFGILAGLVYVQWLLGLRHAVLFVLAALMVWGASRAIPYLPVYGMDTLRDSALWAYGAYAALLACFLPRSPWFDRVPQLYTRWLPRLLIWVPVALLASQVFRSLLWLSPASGSPMALMKGGDAGVHIGGIAAFLLLGLNGDEAASEAPLYRVGWGIWTLWLVAFVCVMTLNRGGGVAAVGAILVIAALRPRDTLRKVPVIVALGVTAVLVLMSANVKIELGRRDISALQIEANVASIVGLKPPEGMQNLDKTKDWRLEWWEKIVDYTIRGRYRWVGKGFGVDLARDDGITMGKTNRNPHSAHMNFLARSGIPGLLLWILLNFCFAATLFRAYLNAQRERRDRWARLDLWILAYWAAFIVNASFDVFLEGPPGGIWFWSIIGYGVTVASAQRQSLSAAKPVNAWAYYRREAAAHS
jgi:hypothetical protein